MYSDHAATWCGFIALLFGIGLCASLIVYGRDWVRAWHARRIVRAVLDYERKYPLQPSHLAPWGRRFTARMYRHSDAIIRGRDLL